MFQKLFSTFFAYIIGFQLVVGAIPHHALNTSAWANSCSSGLQWNEMLGRCVTTAQAAQIADASKMCESKGDEAAKKQCYRDVIDGKMKDEGVTEAGKIKTDMISVGLAMISLASAAMFLLTGGPSVCPGATSAYLIVGGAVAVMAGEVMSAATYKKKLKAAEEKFKSVADSSKDDSNNSSSTTSDNKTATSAQGEAFQAMIELEEATISAAKTKNMLYMVATAAYAAAAVMSVMELIRYNAAIAAMNTGVGTAAAAAEIKAQTCSTAIAMNGSPLEKAQLRLEYAAMGAPQAPKTLAEIYVDNYFINNQRVSFDAYNSLIVDKANDVVEFSYLHQEQMLLMQGQHVGLDIANYETIRAQMLKATNVSAEDFSMMKVARNIIHSFTVPSAQASSFLAMGAMAGGLALPALTGGGNVLKKLYLLPHSRAALAGAMTLNNVFMIMKTNKEKKKAEERKEFIEKLKAQVEAAGAEFGCANNDRNDLAKPNCYCYSEGGGLNPARVNSTTCKNLFGAKPSLASGKTGNPTDVSNQRNCVTNAGALDSSCSCRSSNTCVSVKSPTLVGNVPSGNVLGNLPQTLNGLNSGTLSAADINGAQMGALGAKLNKINDSLLADPKNKPLALQIKKAKEQADKAMKDIQRSLAGSALAAAPSGSSGFLNASTPTAALEEMKKDLSQQIKGYEGNSVPMAGGGAGKKGDDFSLDALSGNGGVTVADEQLADAMNSQYDLGNSDINTDSGANIFSILSSRYQRSGMRRLFGGEALVPADKPASSEISR